MSAPWTSLIQVQYVHVCSDASIIVYMYINNSNIAYFYHNYFLLIDIIVICLTIIICLIIPFMLNNY